MEFPKSSLLLVSHEDGIDPYVGGAPLQGRS